MNKGKETLILILLSSLLFAQNYILKNDVLNGGGRKATNVNYTAWLSLGQTTVGKINNPSYTVRIGFWNFYYFGGPSAISENLPKRIPALRISSPTRTPFNITYTAPDKTPVSLTIYNTLGRKVYSEKSAKGTFTIKNLPAGMYLLRLESKGYKEERKLVIVK